MTEVFINRTRALFQDIDRFSLSVGVKYFADYEIPLMWGSVIMYVAFLIFGPMVIKKTGPIPGLRWPLVFWNIFLSVGSTWMAWDSTSDLVTTAINKPLRYTVCDGSFLEGRLGFMAMLFALSKIPELVDTVFLILRQKPVILLHYYHHISVLMYCYWCYQLGSPTGRITLGMNLAVHSVMYAYYAGCEMGFSKALSGISIYITTLQISQMVVGLSINAYAVYLADKGGCGDYLANVVGFFMYLSYFFLFAQFFVARYFRRRDTKAKAAAASKKAQ